MENCQPEKLCEAVLHSVIHPIHRRVFELVCQGFSFREISEELHLTEQNVRTIFERAQHAALRVFEDEV